jgi:hypothetical protein
MKYIGKWLYDTQEATTPIMARLFTRFLSILIEEKFRMT